MRPAGTIVFLGDMISDCIIFVQDGFLTDEGLQKGKRLPVDISRINAIVKKCGSASFGAGGSAVNSAYIYAALGCQSKLLTVRAQDASGVQCVRDLNVVGVSVIGETLDEGSFTRICLALVTPEGERTMLVNDGACLQDADAVLSNLSAIDYDGLFLSAYLIGGLGQDGLRDIVGAAKSAGKQIYFSLSDPAIVEANREFLLELIRTGVSLFGNKPEFDALGIGDNIDSLLDQSCFAAMTQGRHGSWILNSQGRIHIPAMNVDPRNTTGAGDHYAAAFLAAHASGYDLRDCAAFASKVAAEKVSAGSSRISAAEIGGLRAQLYGINEREKHGTQRSS